MGKVKLFIKFDNLAAITQPLVEDTTNRIAIAAGDGFVGDVIWTDRPHGAVRAETIQAKTKNAYHNTLLKAAGESRVS